MMITVYRMIERNHTGKEGAPTYYGIGAYRYDSKTKKYITLIEIHDITEDKSRLFKLVQDCNKYELDLLHIHDIVDDFLYEKNEHGNCFGCSSRVNSPLISRPMGVQNLRDENKKMGCFI